MTIGHWLAERRRTETGSLLPISLEDSREWRMESGALSHRSGGFFSVRGVHVSAPGSIFHDQYLPMIDQPEIGLLAFAVAPSADGAKWLIQAKSEPGSVDWVQAAPTVQATHSNYTRKHGGAATRFLDLFMRNGETAPPGALNSEQGNRFVGKLNRNAISTVREPFDSGHANWRWFEASDVRCALAQDFAVNTDARSVIACGDWALLRADDRLFAGATWAGPELSWFRTALAEGFYTEALDAEECRRIVGDLRRNAVPSARISFLPLNSLPGWRWTGGSLTPKATSASPSGGIGLYAVEAPGREVAFWDQPFLLPGGEQRVCLALAVREGRLRVGLRPVEEPGFLGRREFGPTFQSDGDAPEAIRDLFAEAEGAALLAVRQSDEGGRFLASITRYEVLFFDEYRARLLDDRVAWVGFRVLGWLCQQQGVMTNEARSAVSVLLSLA